MERNVCLITFILQILVPICFSQIQSWQEILQDSDFAYAIKENSAGIKAASCALTSEEETELQNYKEIVDKILESSIHGEFSGKTYQKLGSFVDRFGSRLSGSQALEKSIDYMLKEMEKSKLTNIHSEVVEVPQWKRGDEIAKLLVPRNKSLEILTLGYSVPTPDEGITATAIVVQSFEELMQRQNEVKGKIVVYSSRGRNAFGHTMIGAAFAAKFGAVAALTRSSSPFSLNTPHTGVQLYDSIIPKIPVAALSSEDADLLLRLAKLGDPLEIYLKIGILSSGMTQSRNIIGDLKGTEKPEEYVVVSGHIDSWDVGQGALDDGVGVVLTSEVVNLLRSLNLQPKRTIRTIYWTAEEMGLYGGRQYVSEHQKSMNQYSAALEADYGCLKAMGYIFSGDPKIGCVLREVMNLLTPKANLTHLIQTDFMPTDVAGFTAAGIPTVVLHGDDSRYFWYHHTEADVLTALDSKELDICLGVWTATSYIIADMKENLPRHKAQEEDF